jgi:hypothetical protein
MAMNAYRLALQVLSGSEVDPGPRRDQTHTHELFRLRKPDATGEINRQRRSHARDYSVRVPRATS